MSGEIIKPEQRKFLHPQSVCDRALQMVIAKLTHVPPVVVTNHELNVKIGTVFNMPTWGNDPLSFPICEDQIVYRPVVMNLTSMWKAQSTDDLRVGDWNDWQLPMDEFAQKCLDKITTKHAEEISKDMSEMKEMCVFAKLILPKEVQWVGFSENKGLWMRMIRCYEISVHEFLTRFDFLYGGI